MPKEMDLNGTWEAIPVSRFDGKYDSVGKWHEVSVPGHWQQVPELSSYAGKVVYRRSFKFMPEPGKRFFLRLNGVFYWATAYLNGARLGANEGYFFPVDYEITRLLQKDNSLLVEVDCPDEIDKTKKRQITGVFHHWDCLDPKTNPGGIWLPVEIHSTGPAKISDPFFGTVYLGRGQEYARIAGQATLNTPEPARLRVVFSFLPRNFAAEPQVFERLVHKSAGTHTYHYHFDVKNPALWWTHDHGRPNLYTLRMEVFVGGEDKPSDVWETAFGIRTFELREYIAFLNGRRMYLRGNNYPPGDTRLATMTRERAEEDIRLAKECHLNFLRVHAHVDHPVFYEVCDEQGMLLWQDFPLQWYYRPEVAAPALRQVERMIFHLGTHPAIGVWCMHNEPIRQFDVHKRVGPLSIARWLSSIFIWNHNRDRMDHELARKARNLDPHRFVTHCSGERGLFRTPGDTHLYYGWYFGPLHWLHRKYLKRPEELRFVTEFGAQSFPNLENARQFMAETLNQVDWKKLKARHHYQPFFMNLFVNPKKYKTLADFIQATQDYQAKVNQYYIDRLRALKYKPSGGFAAFVLLDSNPAVQWSVIDYWRTPKSSYYALQKATCPVYAFTLIAKPRFKLNEITTLPVFGVNDTWEEAKIAVALEVTSPVGETVLKKDYTMTLPPDCEALVLGNPELKLRWAGTYHLRLTLDGPLGKLENKYQLVVK